MREPRLVASDEPDSHMQPLRGDHVDLNGVELEDIRGTMEELRALLHRERHDHSVEVLQLKDTLRDQELRTRLVQRALQQLQREHTLAEESVVRLTEERQGWRERCNELGLELNRLSRDRDRDLDLDADVASRSPLGEPSRGIALPASGGGQAAAEVTAAEGVDAEEG